MTSGAGCTRLCRQISGYFNAIPPGLSAYLIPVDGCYYEDWTRDILGALMRRSLACSGGGGALLALI